MEDKYKTKKQLINELVELRQKITELDAPVIERTRAEKELRESKERYSALFDQAADSIVLVDSETGTLVEFNERAYENLGYTRKEFERLKIPDFEVIETADEVSKHIKKIIKLGADTFETKHRMKDGQIRDIHVSSRVISIRGKKFIQNIFRDVTERRNAEKKIREAKDFSESVIENSRDGIVITDAKGYITSLNTAMEKMTNFTKEDLIGKHASIFTTEDKKMRKIILEKTAEMLEKGFASYEAVQKTKDGRFINVECNSSLIKDDKGNYLAGVSIVRDITERKKMEHQLFQTEKLKSMGELAGGVAHGFNNILATILGRVQLLRKSIDTPPQRKERRKSSSTLKKGLEIVENAVLDGAETVRRIQEFSKRGKGEYFTTININEIINEALELTKLRWKNEAESKGINIIIKKVFSPLPFIKGNGPELRELFSNLISNAIDAMPKGGEIRINTLTDNNQFIITVADTGSGIPATIQERIFDPFFTSKGVQSTGLGLSVSYGIIDRHRGSITVDSVEGKGTTFTITFPLSGKTPEEVERIKPLPKKHKKARILVIEDEKDVRELLLDILIDDGHEVETAPDGIKGIKLFKKKDFDLVFTDLGMPEMSGWQVAKEIKKMNKKIPVALITGWNVQLKNYELEESGVDLIVNKPFKVDQIAQLVQKGIEIKEKHKNH